MLEGEIKLSLPSSYQEPQRVAISRDKTRATVKLNDLDLTKFEPLLSTWQLHFPRWRSLQTTKGLRSLELEARYGDGHIEDRRLLLRTALTFLEEHRPGLLPTVFTIIMRTRDMASMESLRRFKLLSDRDRRVKPENRLCRNAVEALKAYRAHYLRTVEIVASKAHESSVIQVIDACLAALGGPAAPEPKLPRGQEAAKAARWAKHELTKIGMPKGLRGFRQACARNGVAASPRNLHDALLMAAGLTSYRSV